MITNKCRQYTYKKEHLTDFFFQVKTFVRVIIMQINRLLSLEHPFMQRVFFGWRLWALRCCLSDLFFFFLLSFSNFSFGWTFSLCSTQEFSSTQPPIFAALRIRGHHQHSVCFAAPCIWSYIVVCAVWFSVVTQTSRAANMVIHVLLWRYVCVGMWKWLTRRKDHFKLTTFTLYCGFKDRTSWHIVSIKTSFTLLTY